MRLVFGLVLLLGIGLAGAAVYLARDYFSQQQARLAEAEAAKLAIVPTENVMVVNKQMRYGQRLTTGDVKVVKWPKAAIPEGAFTTAEDLFPKGADVQRSILRAMEPDEAILAVKVTEPGEDAGVQSKLSHGMRAFTIRTDTTSAVSGFLRPGNNVDVYWTGNAGGSNITQLIHPNLRVIAVNQSADEDNQKPVAPKTVTVEVNPTEVAKLAQAQSSGRLSLALVGVSGGAVEGDVSVSQNDVLGIQRQVEVQERKCYVMRRVGEEQVRTNIETECTN
ncbi:MAG: Flp pilus assembly protein CpaB [Paracoccaceae bacterium]|nr:Flp pilus assembly protein CpaB [Paracoccaceae bacterium]